MAVEVTYIGIDPGKNGAIAWLTSSEVNVVPFSEETCQVILRGIENGIACVEKVGAMPGQGVTSMFHFGENFGYIRGTLEANKIAYQLIPPKTWKKEFGLNSNKESSIAVCKRLFPEVSLKRTERCKKDHDGMAEALLMAEYARRKL